MSEIQSEERASSEADVFGRASDQTKPNPRRDRLPLHLRVLRAMLENSDKPDIDTAFGLAREVYELEAASVGLHEYRSAT